jgi:hypothetical protein
MMSDCTTSVAHEARGGNGRLMWCLIATGVLAFVSYAMCPRWMPAISSSSNAALLSSGCATRTADASGSVGHTLVSAGGAQIDEASGHLVGARHHRTRSTLPFASFTVPYDKAPSVHPPSLRPPDTIRPSYEPPPPKATV